MTTALLVGLSLLACAPGGVTLDDTGTTPSTRLDSGDTDTGTVTDTDTGTVTDTDTGTVTDTDTAPPVETFDCSAPLPVPTPETIITGASAYKGIAFDGEGHLVGSDGNSLIKTTYDGTWEVWLPRKGDVEQLAYLSNGDLITTNGYGEGAVKRYTPEGGETVLVSGLFGYSVIVAPNDRIYVAGWDGAWMIDPDTGDVTEFLSAGRPDFDSGRSSPRTLVFSRDYSQLYVGTIDSEGRIYTLALDDDYVPVGELVLFATGLGNGWHDGLGLDVCGNLYAADYATSSLYRASADGADVVKLVDWSENSRAFAHGLAFGDGVGGWRHDALYLPEPANGKQVKEIVLGVPGVRWEGKPVWGQ